MSINLNNRGPPGTRGVLQNVLDLRHRLTNLLSTVAVTMSESKSLIRQWRLLRQLPDEIEVANVQQTAKPRQVRDCCNACLRNSLRRSILRLVSLLPPMSFGSRNLAPLPNARLQLRCEPFAPHAGRGLKLHRLSAFNHRFLRSSVSQIDQISPPKPISFPARFRPLLVYAK